MRGGKLSSWSANRVVVPLARANADRLLTTLADAPLSTRELNDWFEHYQKASRGSRERMVRHPRLFLDAWRENDEQREGLRLRNGPEGGMRHRSAVHRGGARSPQEACAGSAPVPPDADRGRASSAGGDRRADQRDPERGRA